MIEAKEEASIDGSDIQRIHEGPLAADPPKLTLVGILASVSPTISNDSASSSNGEPEASPLWDAIVVLS